MALAAIPALWGSLGAGTKIAVGVGAYELIRNLFSQFSQMRESDVSKYAIDIQKQIAEAEMTATRRSAKESRNESRNYMAQLLRMQERERDDERAREASMMAGQARNDQMAILMQALYGMSGGGQRTPVGFSPGAYGQTNLLGSSF